MEMEALNKLYKSFKISLVLFQECVYKREEKYCITSKTLICPVLWCDTVQGGFHDWHWGSLFLVLYSCFFLSKIEERLTASSGDLSMSVDEDEDSLDRREVHEPKEDVHSMIQSCRFTMKMKMIESAWKQVHSLSVPLCGLMGASWTNSLLNFPLKYEP